MKKIITMLFLLTISLSINNNIFAQANSVGLNGSFTFNSIASAYTAIGAVGSPQLIELSSSYTGADEVAPVSLTLKPGVSEVNTITIRPSAGANGLSLSKASANSIFRFDSCSYVVLDGRPGGVVSTSSNYLSVSNTTAGGTSNAVIMVGSTYCTVNYINASGVSSSAGCRVLNISGSFTSPSQNNTLSNNVVRGGLRGIQDFGFSAPSSININNTISNNDVAQFNNVGILVSASTGTVLIKNRVHSVSPVATAAQTVGIQAQSTAINAVITENTVDSISSSNATNTAFFLLVDGGVNSTVTKNKVTNVDGTAFITQISSVQLSGQGGTFSNNEISNISLSRASSFNIGIAVTGFLAPTFVNVKNNKILNLSSTSTTNIRAISSFVPLVAAGTVVNMNNNFIEVTAPNNTISAIFGILVGNTAGVGYTANMNYNSIKIGGDATVASGSYGIFKSDNNAGSVYIQKHNNILNVRTSTTTIQFASYIGNATGTLTLDSNNYSAPDTLAGVAAGWIDSLYSNDDLAGYKAYVAPQEAHTTFGSVNKLSLTMNYEVCPNANAVTVELRNSTSPYGLVESASGFAGGNFTNYFTFSTAASGVPYYIVVKGINMIETWSATTVTFGSNSASYDFTTAINKAYGSNQVLSGGVASVYQGDVNQNGSIDLTDLTITYNDVSNFQTSPATDLDCNGTTDLSDLILVFNNSKSFISVKRPPTFDATASVNSDAVRNSVRSKKVVSVGIPAVQENTNTEATYFRQLDK